MAFWTKYLNQARQIDTLSRDLEFEQRKVVELQSLLDREEFRTKALEAEVIKTRNSEIRTLRHHADVMSKVQKAQSSFVTIAKEDEPKPPPPIDAKLDERILWAAEQSRELDINDGIEPAPLEEYVAIIKRDPSQYLIG